MSKVLHLSVHPRAECTGNCGCCYLKRLTDGNEVLDLETLKRRVEDVMAFYKKHGFDRMTLAYMINTTTPKKIAADCRLIPTLIQHEIKMKEVLDSFEIYIGNNMVDKASCKKEYNKSLAEMLALITHTKSISNIDSSLWISNAHELDVEDEIMRDYLGTMMRTTSINITVTIYPEDDAAVRDAGVLPIVVAHRPKIPSPTAVPTRRWIS